MKIDLHVHSHYSDGSFSIQEIMERAKIENITHLSIVDHDTTGHIATAMKAGEQAGIVMIPGIEISAYDFSRKRKVHILGYNFDDASNIQTLCQPLLKRRHEHSLWQLKQIKTAGYLIDERKMKESIGPDGILYKQHMMNGLINASYDSVEYQKIYRHLFKGKGICAGDILYVDAKEAVTAIKADGGQAVLAHPGQLDSYEIIEELVRYGLDGIERNHYDHTQKDVIKVEQYAKEYDLLMTGGSDFHGKFGKAIQIGDITCPTTHIEQLLTRYNNCKNSLNSM